MFSIASIVISVSNVTSWRKNPKKFVIKNLIVEVVEGVEVVEVVEVDDDGEVVEVV